MPTFSASGGVIIPQGGSVPIDGGVPIEQNDAQRARALQDAGYQTPTVTPQIKTEPAVLSSGQITDEIIPANNKKFEDLSKKGTYVGIDGNTYYSDGSLVPAPLEAEYDGTAWKAGGQSYGAGPEIIDNPESDPAVANTNRILASLKASLDESTLGQVNAIQQQYDMLRQRQEEANTRNLKGRERALLLGGSARYAPLAAEGAMLAQTNYGLQQIQKLDADENLAIANVREAQRKGNYDIMEKGLNTIETIRSEKQKAAQQVAEALSKANADAAKREVELARDESIAQVIASGLTDPASIYAAMRSQGADVTVDEIKGVVSALVPKAENSDLYKFDTSNVGKLLAAGMNAGMIQAVQDYLNGHGDAAAWNELTPAQQAVVQTVLNGKKAAATTETAGGGMTEKEFIAQYHKKNGSFDGLDKALEEFRANNVSRPDPKSNYTATSIPQKIRSELESDIINTEATLAELYKAYPDVSSSYISSLFNSLRKKTTPTVSDEDFLKQLQDLTK